MSCSEVQEVNPKPPNLPKRKKAATKRKGQTIGEEGGEATKGRKKLINIPFEDRACSGVQMTTSNLIIACLKSPAQSHQGTPTL